VCTWVQWLCGIFAGGLDDAGKSLSRDLLPGLVARADFLQRATLRLALSRSRRRHLFRRVRTVSGAIRPISTVAEMLRLEYVLPRGFSTQVRTRIISMVHPGYFSAVQHARHNHRPLEATGFLYAPSRTSSTHIYTGTIIAACCSAIQRL